MAWFHRLFQQNTMEENYVFLVQSIYNQICTDASDYIERDYIHEKPYIEYFLEHIDESYKNSLFKIIPYDILKKKVLDVDCGFNNNCEEDYKLSFEINRALYYELHPISEYNCGCSECGCLYEKDCCCEKCNLSGCVYVN